MAEPLTSSDIIREQMGFGVSPMAAPETRKAYFETGLSPLTTGQRESFKAGAGISPMASSAEKEAWIASEVRAGMRPESDMPKLYGGLGERPEATTRRGFRMQQEWDAKRAAAIEEQKMRQQMEESNKTLQLRELEYKKGIDNDRISREEKLQKEADDFEARQQAKSFFENVKTIDFKNDPDAILKIDSILNDNPRALEVQGVTDTINRKRAIAETYGAAVNNKQAQQLAQYTRESINKYIAAGGDLNDEAMVIATKVDPFGNKYVDPFELQQQTALIEGAKAKEERAAKSPEAKKTTGIEEEAKSERSKIRSSIRDLEDKIATEEAIQASGAKGQELKRAQAAIKVYQSQIQKRKTELEQFGSGETTAEAPSVPTIKSKEEFNNLPSGAEYIGPNGKKYRKN